MQKADQNQGLGRPWLANLGFGKNKNKLWILS
jgi:hypothetical protein